MPHSATEDPIVVTWPPTASPHDSHVPNSATRFPRPQRTPAPPVRRTNTLARPIYTKPTRTRPGSPHTTRPHAPSLPAQDIAPYNICELSTRRLLDRLHHQIKPSRTHTATLTETKRRPPQPPPPSTLTERGKVHKKNQATARDQTRPYPHKHTNNLPTPTPKTHSPTPWQARIHTATSPISPAHRYPHRPQTSCKPTTEKKTPKRSLAPKQTTYDTRDRERHGSTAGPSRTRKYSLLKKLGRRGVAVGVIKTPWHSWASYTIMPPDEAQHPDSEWLKKRPPHN
ncbi:unnamed protein product [Pleuronectes platessa]|uniref:Uncharacterized protein n=1 Tax=Pleuronectes platessa TaxID=8262 RepID=A0A9N7W418_PLEPL|nr:unnamed protein product [Pleuronectes platessa]